MTSYTRPNSNALDDAMLSRRKLQQRQQHRLSPEDLDFSAMRVVKAEARMPMLILL